jgi:hypothetical protein
MKKDELVRTNLKALVIPNDVESSFLVVGPISPDCDCREGNNSRNSAVAADEDLIF